MVLDHAWSQVVCCGLRKKQQRPASADQQDSPSQDAVSDGGSGLIGDDEPVPECIAFSSGRYAVLPATSIRVLRLKPAIELESSLEGDLITVPRRLDLTCAYDALSYAWDGAFNDEPLPDDEMMLAGTSFKIAGNLGHALRRLRGNLQTRNLWTDAICINQEDDDEKSVQVQNMSTVYSNARQVIAWLGEDSLSRDGEAVLYCAKQSLGGEPLASNDEKAVAACNGAQKFWTRRYFSRRWMVQEYTLARSLKVVCGANSVQWTTSCDFRTWARELPKALEAGRTHILDPKSLDSKYWRAPDASSLDNVLVGYHGLDCRDERDRIYALLSLIEHDYAVTVDYKLPWPQVYHDFMRSVIQVICPALGFSSRNFTVVYRLLCVAASQAEQDIEGYMTRQFPSWVPNWLSDVAAHDAEGLDIYWDPSIFLGYYAGLHGEGLEQYLMLFIEQYEPVNGVLSPGVNIEPIYCPQYVPDDADCVVGPRHADVHSNHREYVNAVGGCLLLRPLLMGHNGVHRYHIVGRCSLMTTPGLFRSQQRTFSII